MMMHILPGLKLIQLGYVPIRPGDEVYLPQPMVSQIRDVLEQYQTKGGTYHEL